MYGAEYPQVFENMCMLGHRPTYTWNQVYQSSIYLYMFAAACKTVVCDLDLSDLSDISSVLLIIQFKFIFLFSVDT